MIELLGEVTKGGATASAHILNEGGDNLHRLLHVERGARKAVGEDGAGGVHSTKIDSLQHAS